jgi:hypothetical protein
MAGLYHVEIEPETRSAETAEVARALQAQKACEADHGPAHFIFDREVP